MIGEEHNSSHCRNSHGKGAQTDCRRYDTYLPQKVHSLRENISIARNRSDLAPETPAHRAVLLPSLSTSPIPPTCNE